MLDATSMERIIGADIQGLRSPARHPAAPAAAVRLPRLRRKITPWGWAWSSVRWPSYAASGAWESAMSA